MRLCAFRLTLLVTVLILPAARAMAQESQREPITPSKGMIQLFNGKDLNGLYTFMKDTKYEDPRQIFTVRDGLLRISGDGFGGVITKEAYRNYHLICEFKWGEQTWAPRVDRARDSGILVHCTGADGAYGGIWMESIEAQIIEGGTGDFIVVNGKGPAAPSLTCEVSKDRDGEDVWTKGGEKKTFTGGRINWYGRDPNWDDVINFRGPKDVESPHGQWNHMEVICDGGQVAIRLNGVLVNEGFDVHPAAGKLTIQTEGAEIFIRRWELWPLGQAPPFDPASLQK